MKLIDIKERILDIVGSKSLEQSLNECTTIGERLKILRKRTGLSRAKLSTEIGIETNVINKYENGYMLPKSERIKQFADYYKVPEKYITGDAAEELLKEDYLLISNLNFYCWQIHNDFKRIDDINILMKSVLEADLIAIKSINSYNKLFSTQSNDYMIYVYRCFSTHNESITELGDLMKIVYELIEDTEAGKTIPFSIESIFRILDYAICTLDCVSKDDFRLVLKELTPLIENYKNQ